MRGPGQKNTFTPDNDAKANLWFWRDYAGLFASAFAGTDRTPIAAFLDAEGAAPGGWPKGHATLVDLAEPAPRICADVVRARGYAHRRVRGVRVDAAPRGALKLLRLIHGGRAFTA